MNLLNRRIPTLLALIGIMLGAVGLIYYFSMGKPQIASSEIPQKVRITNVADNKFSVSWVTQDATIGAIEYGKVGEKLDIIVNDERDSGGTANLFRTHHVTIGDLQPNTQYAFRILVGEKSHRFDNNGSPYLISTGGVIGNTPVSRNFYGKVVISTQQAASGAIVYLSLPGAAVVSTLVNESGNYAFTLSTVRTSDLKGYVKVDPAATIASITIENGTDASTATVSLANAAPVPTITLGKDVDFRNAVAVTTGEEPVVAEIQEPAEKPGIFNVEPLSNSNEINAVGGASVIILNPAVNGETISTLRPEFRGTGPKDTVLSIAITGQKTVSEVVMIEEDGTWSYAPLIDLKAGQQTIAVSYIGSGGVEQKIEREFVITETNEPAFVATPSASKKASPSPTPRQAMPATESGVPVTGVVENTIVVMLVGILTLIGGVGLVISSSERR